MDKIIEHQGRYLMIKIISNSTAGLLVLFLTACSTFVSHVDINSNTVEQLSVSETQETDLHSEQRSHKVLLSLEAYDSNSETALNLTLFISEEDQGFKYRMLSGNEIYINQAEIIWTGDLSFKTIQEIKLFEIPWEDYPQGNYSSTVELINSEQGLVFQNYGNSMNYYKILPLDYKYITFRLQKD